MSERRPPFDPIRAAFWLVAGVIAVHCVVVIGGAATCFYWSASVLAGKFSCTAVGDRLNELLLGALAAALAFAAGFNKQ
jgi:hypothetical protein